MKNHRLTFAVDESSYDKEDHIGVRKKVNSQLALFKRNGIEATLQKYSWKDGLPTVILDDNTDILYFRRIGASVRLVKMLRDLKKEHPGLRIIMELPIYPFKDERQHRTALKSKINESLGTLMWRLCVDRIVLISNSRKSLYGIPVINVDNGIDFDEVRVRKASDGDSINMIAVSGCFFWHGYDRLIKGLGEYYNNGGEEDVNLYVVGEGTCSGEYRELSDSYGLTDRHVFFCGILDGEKLDEVYDRCDLAVDCLGAHRKNNYYSSSLKSREYAAKGLPIVSSLIFDIENEKTDKWFLRLPADETDTDVSEIVEYYKTIYGLGDTTSKQKTAELIRENFSEYCDINRTFAGVTDYILNDK